MDHISRCYPNKRHLNMPD